jgi:hypothetical protein
MRTLGEAKLAINNLYNRITGKSKNSDLEAERPNNEKYVTSTNNASSKHQEPQAAIEAATQVPLNTVVVDDKSVADKLHAIQDRLIDLQIVASKVEQLLSKDKSK